LRQDDQKQKKIIFSKLNIYNNQLVGSLVFPIIKINFRSQSYIYQSFEESRRKFCGFGQKTPYWSRTVNRQWSIWKNVCQKADISGKTPHSARHAMGKHIIEKTGNISAVQRQLGHKNVAYSVLIVWLILGLEMMNYRRFRWKSTKSWT